MNNSKRKELVHQLLNNTGKYEQVTTQKMKQHNSKYGLFVCEERACVTLIFEEQVEVGWGGMEAWNW